MLITRLQFGVDKYLWKIGRPWEAINDHNQKLMAGSQQRQRPFA